RGARETARGREPGIGAGARAEPRESAGRRAERQGREETRPDRDRAERNHREEEAQADLVERNAGRMGDPEEPARAGELAAVVDVDVGAERRDREERRRGPNGDRQGPFAGHRRSTRRSSRTRKSSPPARNVRT